MVAYHLPCTSSHLPCPSDFMQERCFPQSLLHRSPSPPHYSPQYR